MMLVTSDPTDLPSTSRARRRPVVAVATGLLLVGLLGACTSDDPTTGDDPAATDDASVATSDGAAPTGDGSAAPTGDGSAEPTAEAPEEIVVDAGDEDACALLPQDELDAVIGEAATATPVPSGGWIAGQCSWSGPETGFFLSIGTETSIADFGDPAATDARSRLEAFSTRQADQAREVSEIGDGAVAGPSGVAARVGTTYLELEVLSLPDGQAEQVLQLAVDNLPSS